MPGCFCHYTRFESVRQGERGTGLRIDKLSNSNYNIFICNVRVLLAFGPGRA